MSAIAYLKKKIGSSYLVWFENSNSYLQFEQPAWFVFRETVKRFSEKAIAQKFAVRYGISFEDSLAYVSEIRSGIEKINQVKRDEDKLVNVSEKLKTRSFQPYAVHQYQIGNQWVTFCFETPVLENYLHPLINHLEKSDRNSENYIFELFNHEEAVVFRFGGEVKGVWHQDESHLVKGVIFMFLINVMYGKTDDDWLMTVHASAITNGQKTILFSAAPGQGKTTIAALLQTRGYRLISDDFVPIDCHSFCAYPFPIAMSVKEGSMNLLAPHFPSLEQKPLKFITPEKSVRYFASDQSPDPNKDKFPVTEFIFVKYDSSVDFLFEKIDPLNAIKLLLEEAWVSPKRSNVEKLFDQILSTSFYKLTYSDNKKALDAITNLFDND